MSKLASMNTPIFWAEGHPGKLDRESWTIEVTGSCNKPRIFSWQDLLVLPPAQEIARLTSDTRWSVKGLWSGVRLSTILDEVDLLPSCKFVRFWSHRLIYDTSIPLDIALKPKTMVAWEFDNELLDENYGGPVRIMTPYLWGYKSAKCLVKIELMDYYQPGFWELRGYTDSGEIEAGPCLDVNEGHKLKRIGGGEVVEFLD
ncbi:MAG: molybdopterin-dependent oxidoreductase [Candidatus Cloacimonetes bacterium]|nr:molybdopterin-dependent oxidoreductase [Candidatus Cloacimonadota bacterium]